MSNDRLYPQLEVAELIEGAIRRAHIAERLRCANIASMYPLEHFTYDTNNHGEILRLRDTISEAILKNVPAGEMIK
jgi:hypothetical protein